MKEKYLKNLSEEEKFILKDKGTEKPFSGEYNDFYEAGIFVCKACNAPLYESKTKFDSGCGWPSFDDQIKGAIKCYEDLSGGRVRTEICCAKCDGHLGHVFFGEHFTVKNTRHCVNSLSIQFKAYKKLEKATVAGGNFWYLDKLYRDVKGVYLLYAGYMGGDVQNPTYEQVQTGKTNHVEVVQLFFDPNIISYTNILDIFLDNYNNVFSIKNAQKIKSQHKPIIFVNNKKHKEKAEVSILYKVKKSSYLPTIQIKTEKEFFRAEECHQNYFNKQNT